MTVLEIVLVVAAAWAVLVLAFLVAWHRTARGYKRRRPRDVVHDCPACREGLSRWSA